MDIKERILEILCNRCNVENEGYCEECEKEGDYKEVEKMIDQLAIDLREDFEYEMWEQSMGEDL